MTTFLDLFGVRHAIRPGRPRPPRPGEHRYGDAPRLIYACGCAPVVHRFRCSVCGGLAGWCFGCDDDEPDACDACWAKGVEAPIT